MKSNIDDILDNVDMIDVIEEYVDLKELKNNQFIGVCPFHDDKNPSFSVNPEKGVYHCFGCGASGNLITFLENIENKDFTFAIKKLSKISGIPYHTKELTAEEKKLKRRHELMEDVQHMLQHILFTPVGKEALDKIKSRGLSEKDIRLYGLGYCDKKSIEKYFKANDISLDEQIQTKLVELNNNNINYPIEGRITFPIKNINGKPIGFSGGRVKDDVIPKYKHSIFLDEGSGFFFQDSYFGSDKPITIVEGFYDQISLSMCGADNVISSLGTSSGASDDKVKCFLSKSNKFVICMDGDVPGEESAIKLGGMLKKNNDFGDSKVKLVLIPGDIDPDDYRRKFGLDKLKEVYDKQLSLIDFAAAYEKKKAKENNTNNEDLVKNLIALTKFSDDDIQKEMFLNSLSKEFNLSEDSINSYLTKVKDEEEKKDKKEKKETAEDSNFTLNLDELFDEVNKNDNAINPIIDEPAEQALYIQEQAIISYLIHHPEELKSIDKMNDAVLQSVFPHDFAYQSYRLIKKEFTKDDNTSVKAMIDGISNDYAIEKLFLERASKLSVDKEEYDADIDALQRDGNIRLIKEDVIKDMNTDVKEENKFDFDDYLNQLRSAQQ